MKRYIILLIIQSCLSFSMNAQEKVKLTFNEYYYELLDTTIKSIEIEPAEQRYIDELSGTAVGINGKIDTSFMKIATCIEHNDEYYYLLHYKSKTGSAIGITFDLKLPEGVSLRFETIDGILDTEYNYEANSFNKRLGTSYNTYSYNIIKDEMIVKLILKNNDIENTQINIMHFTLFKGFFLTNSQVQKSALNATSDYNCGFVPCMNDYLDWINEWSSVFLIIAPVTEGSITHYLSATGFVLNPSDSYGFNLGASPLAITCAHTFDKALELGYSIEDILKSYSSTAQFKTHRASCGISSVNDLLIRPRFKVISNGDYYLSKAPEDDYVIMQFMDSYNLDYFGKNGLTLAGYNRKELTYNDLQDGKPYVCFHNGKAPATSIEMRYAKDNHAPADIGNQLRFNIDNVTDEGFTFTGSSGSPVFNKNHQVIGMQLSGDNSCTDPDAQYTTAIKFSYLFNHTVLSNYLGEKDITYSYNFNQNLQPAHCNNCETDASLGEEDFNCGGPCRPCKTYYTKNSINLDGNSLKDVNRPNVYSTNGTITVSGTESNPAKFKSGITNTNVLNSKQEAVLGPNTEVETGIELLVNVSPDYDYSIFERKCNGFDCPRIPNVVFWGDFWEFTAKGITCYYFTLEDRYGHKIIEQTGEVTEDGVWYTWDSNTGNSDYLHPPSPQVIYYLLELWDCNEIKHEYLGFFTMFVK